MREEFEVWNIATSEPSLTERRGELVSAEVEPPIDVDPGAVLPRSDSLAAVAEHSPHSGHSGRASSGANSNSDGIKPPKPRQVPLDHGRRKGRNGARAANDRHPGRRSQRAQGTNAGDELAAVRQVDVVTARFYRRACHGVVLALERTCRVNQYIDAQTSNDVG